MLSCVVDPDQPTEMIISAIKAAGRARVMHRPGDLVSACGAAVMHLSTRLAMKYASHSLKR
jgi:hypothetical protein